MATVSKSLRKKMEARKKSIKSGKGGLGYIIIKEGTIRVRALRVPDDEEPGIEVMQFYLGGDMGGFISPASIGKKCAFHEFYHEGIKSKDKTKKELAGLINPKQRFMMAVIKYEDTKGKVIDEKNSPKLVLLTGGLYQSCIDLFIDTDEWGDFTDLNEGYDLKLIRTGAGQFDTEYSVMPCSKSPTPKAYRKIVANLADMVAEVVPSYEETKQKLEEWLSTNPLEKKSSKGGKSGDGKKFGNGKKLNKKKSDL